MDFRSWGIRSFLTGAINCKQEAEILVSCTYTTLPNEVEKHDSGSSARIRSLVVFFCQQLDERKAVIDGLLVTQGKMFAIPG